MPDHETDSFRAAMDVTWQQLREQPSLQSVIDAYAALAAAGPYPVAARIAPDVWSALRRDQDRHRPLLAPPPAIPGIPVTVDDDLERGGWRVAFSDGTERSSDERPSDPSTSATP